jgi:hypothetical protein
MIHDDRPYLFVSRELRVQDQPLNIVELLSLGMRRLLASLDAENNLAHDLKFLPVDARFVLADKCLVAFFSGDKVTAVEG